MTNMLEGELAAERNTPLTVAAIKAAREPPVTSAGKTKAKQIKKIAISSAG